MGDTANAVDTTDTGDGLYLAKVETPEKEIKWVMLSNEQWRFGTNRKLAFKFNTTKQAREVCKELTVRIVTITRA